MINSNRNTHGNTALRLVFACFICDVLAAYSTYGIPLPWIGLCLAPVAAAACLAKTRMPSFPGRSFVLAYAVYALLINLYYFDVDGRFEALMPPLSTTHYPVFIALRFFRFLSCVSFLSVLWFLLKRGEYERLKRFLIGLGCFVSIAGLYIYAAQILGLPELLRTRVGTGGVAVLEVSFNCDFHRVLGTFREPSHLAEWLILPMFLAFGEGRKCAYAQVLMSITMLMTGSMAGICSSAIGFAAALVFFNPLKGKQIRTIFSMLLLAWISLQIAQSSIYSYSTVGDARGIWEVLEERSANILEGGMEASNRKYIYDYVKNNPPSFFGVGLGNSNLLLGDYLGWDAVCSFLNLFFNTLYSTGIPGLTLMVCFFSTPFYQALQRRRTFVRERGALFLFAAYASYCVNYWVHGEELSFSFVAAYVLLLHCVFRMKDPSPRENKATAEHIAPDTTGFPPGPKGRP